MHTELKTKKKELERIVAKMDARLKGCPQGFLICHRQRGKNRFYILNSGKQKYIADSDSDLAVALAQKTYCVQIRNTALKQISAIDRFLKTYKVNAMADIYKNLSVIRQKLVIPEVLPDAEFRKVWETEKFETNTYEFGQAMFYTDKGERVRSKSEVIIANTLKSLKIPYRYECVLQLSDGHTVFPDFTVLDMKTRKEFYIEHFGMMDNEKYRGGAFRKIESYAENGIFLGERLLAFFEDSEKPLNTVYLRCVLTQKFL